MSEDEAEPGLERAVSMHDVAEAARVSIATVSRTLSGAPGVSEATRQRVREIAERLQYVVSPEASGLAKGATGRIAVVVTTVTSWFFATMLSRLETVLRDAGYDVLLYQVDGAEQRRRFFEELPARRKADGVIVVTVPVPEEQARRLSKLGMHVVVAGSRVLDYPSVRINDVEAGRIATEHLLSLGHRRVAMVRTVDVEGELWAADRERYAGYRAALAGASIPHEPELVVDVPFGVEPGRQAWRRLGALEDPPTAVFAHADEVAFGIYNQVRSSGLRCPEDVSVIGVDDHPYSAAVELTTVHQDIDGQARRAAEGMLRLLRGESFGPQDTVLPCELVVRRTTGPPSR